MTDDRRALAERLAREVYEKAGPKLPGSRLPWVLREAYIELVLAGLSHRDPHAEREAARKAWDEAVMAVAEFTHDDPRAITYQSLGQYRSDLYRHIETVIKHDLARYLARAYPEPTPPRVTLSDGSVVTRRITGGA